MYTNFSLYEGDKVPLSVMMNDYFYCTKMGLKSLYYQNSKGGIKEGSNIEEDIVIKVSDIVEEDEECDACKM